MRESSDSVPEATEVAHHLHEYQRYRRLPVPLANLLRSPLRLSLAFALAVDVLTSVGALVTGASAVPLVFALVTIPFEAYALYALIDC